MCEYCDIEKLNGDGKCLVNDEHTRIWINKGYKKYYLMQYGGFCIEIDYCPMCGRKLEE